MRKAVKKCLQWGALITLLLLGFTAFLFLAGEENPECRMPFWQWALIKFITLLVIYSCALAAKKLYQKGFLPDCINKILEEDN